MVRLMGWSNFSQYTFYHGRFDAIDEQRVALTRIVQSKRFRGIFYVKNGQAYGGCNDEQAPLV